MTCPRCKCPECAKAELNAVLSRRLARETSSDGLCPVPPAKTPAVSTQTACETEGVSNDSAATRRMPDGVGSLACVIATSRCENGVSPGPSEIDSEVEQHNAAALQLNADQSAWRDTVGEGGR